MKEKNKGWMISAVAGCAVILGAGLGVSAYQRENQFQPVSADRDIQVNQVIFSQDENGAGYEREKSGSEGEIWQKDHEAEEKNRPGIQEGADYLYEDGKLKDTDPSNGVLDQGNQNNISNLIDNWNGKEDTTGNGNPSYGLTDDLSSADLVISGGSASFSEGSSSTGGSASSSSENDSTETGNKGWTDSGNSGSSEKPAPSGNPAPMPSGMPMPSKRPADNVKDPVPDKPDVPEIPGKGDISQKEYREDLFKGTEDTNYQNVNFTRPSGFGRSILYLGQNVDQRTIYNSLDASVTGKDQIIYVWGKDALDTYIQINSISLDNGQSWITEFPATISTDTDVDHFKIRVSYRFSGSGKWTEKEVDYKLLKGRIYILKEALDNENPVLESENILNNNEAYPADNQKQQVNLYKYQKDKFGVSDNSAVYEIFPGWKENGELVPWIYPATAGRHILEPADMIPLDYRYTVQLRQCWMDDDGRVGSGEKYRNLSYLQTLTSVDESAKEDYHAGGKLRIYSQQEKKLSVPEYIQAVDIESNPYAYWNAVETDYLELPESVIYINTDNDSFRINSGYLVNENNRYYKAENGILVDKEETEMLGIPYRTTRLSVPAHYTKVNISGENQIRQITFEAETEDQIPEIAYEKLSDCKFIIQDDLLNTYLAENYDYIFENEGNQVVLQKSKTAYVVKKDAIVNTDGELYKVISTEGKEITLSQDVKRIGEAAFEEQPGITKLILDKKGQKIELEENCFKGSGIRVIFCYSKEQYDSITEQLEKGKTGASDIRVEFTRVSAEGHEYYIESQNGHEDITLIRAAKECKTFEGILTDEDTKEKIRVTQIGDNAFADCDQLVWVTLPEEISRIGYQAFKNCISLEGIFSEIKSRIVIGNKAFDGCNSLQIIACNAMEAEMQGGYSPEIADDYGIGTFYVPEGSTGYGRYAGCFGDVSSFQAEEAGAEGKIIYGCDKEGSRWLLVKGTGTFRQKIEIPESVQEIYYYALAGIQAEGEYYSITNLKDTQLAYIDPYAFTESEFGGDAEFGDIVQIRENAFKDCRLLTSVSFRSIKDLPMYLLSGCSKVTDLTIENETPPGLNLYSAGIPYAFFGYGEEDLENNLKIHIPSGKEEAYIKKWRYLLAGYGDMPSKTAHMQWWSDIQWDILSNTWEMPADEVVDSELQSRLLQNENRIRRMLGIAEVKEPTDYYPYHVDNYGIITLVGVPSDCTKLDIADVEKKVLPSGWSIDYVAADTFRGCMLEELVVPKTLAGLESGFLNGIASDHVTLIFEEWTSFTGETKEKPFTFGTDESHITIQVPEGEEADYIEIWAYPMAGYQDLQQMRIQVPEELMEQTGHEPTDEEIERAMAEKLLDPVNSLCSMMGLDKITIEDILKDMLDASVDEKEKTPDPDDTNQPEEKESEEKAPEDQNGLEPGEDTEEQDPDKEASGDENSQDTEDGDSENVGSGNGNSGKDDTDGSEKDTEENKGSSSEGSGKDAGDKTGSKDTGSTEEEIPA